jgi:EpsI family protein
MSHSSSHGQPSTAVRTAVVAVVLLATSAYLTRTSRAEELPPRAPLAQLPLAIESWQGHVEPPFDKHIIDVLGVDDYILRTYAKPGEAALGMYIGYHDSQRQGDTIHSPMNCLPGAGWTPLSQGRTSLTVRRSASAPTQTIETNRVVIGKGLDRQLVLYWYQSPRRVVASEYWGKIYTVLDSIRYNRTDAAMVRIVVPILEERGGESGAETRAVQFAQALFPLLEPHLPA